MYNPNIPQGNDTPANQAPLIKNDFSAFSTVFSNSIGGNTFNHALLNDMTNQGDHETILLQVQSADPTISNNFAALYAKNAPSKAGTQPQLFLRIPQYLPNKFVAKGAPNTPMQLTYNQVNTAGPQYQSFIAAGYLVYFGQVTILSGNNSSIIVLSPAPTKILFAQAFANTTSAGNARAISTSIISNSQFAIFIPTPSVNVSITWMVWASV